MEQPAGRGEAPTTEPSDTPCCAHTAHTSNTSNKHLPYTHRAHLKHLPCTPHTPAVHTPCTHQTCAMHTPCTPQIPATHTLCTLCTRLAHLKHMPCTPYTCAIHTLCTHRAPHTRAMHTLCTHHAHAKHVPCPPHAHTMHTPCTPHTRAMPMPCTPHTRAMHTSHACHAHAVPAPYLDVEPPSVGSQPIAFVAGGAQLGVLNPQGLQPQGGARWGQRGTAHSVTPQRSPLCKAHFPLCKPRSLPCRVAVGQQHCTPLPRRPGQPMPPTRGGGGEGRDGITLGVPWGSPLPPGLPASHTPSPVLPSCQGCVCAQHVCTAQGGVHGAEVHTHTHTHTHTRSEERRVGKECKCRCRSRWSPYH